MRNVTVIPASPNKFSDIPLATTKKRKVAAYARVSTDDEDQQTSYAAQCDYYERYIKSREDWEFVGLYSDEGISGCNTKKREGFRSMVQDALDGKIELIIAKENTLKRIQTSSHPIGFSEDTEYEEKFVPLENVKEIIFSTDGLSELFLCNQEVRFVLHEAKHDDVSAIFIKLKDKNPSTMDGV